MEPLSQKTAESCPPATEDAGHAPAPSVPDAKPVAEETQAAVALCARIEPSLGYHFRDPVLLLTAFTHPSYTFEHPQTPHNQRLEFLGDAVLGLLLADAVFRRFAPEDSGKISFDKLTVDKQAYDLIIDGKRVDAPPKEIELLYFLASSPNRVFTRAQLLDDVWGFDYFGDTRTVDVHVKRLREKLEGVSDKWELKTVWGVGYKFETRD